MNHASAKRYFEERLQKYKMVAAVKDPKHMERVVQYKGHLSAVLLMTGNILSVKNYVEFLQSHGLPVILHVEKIGGLEMDRDGIEFVKRMVKPLGIVTTRNGIIKKAKTAGLLVVQRIFLIDTEVYNHLMKDIQSLQSDVIEIMPSRAPDFVRKIAEVSPIPVLTGGLLNCTEHAVAALHHGATAITTSNVDIWKNDFSTMNSMKP